MPRTPSYDRDALAGFLRRQHGIIGREQALRCGMSPRLVGYRIRAEGPWQVVLPGVYLTKTGDANADQRDMAALLYAGPRSVLTASAALRRFGLAPRTDLVEVLIPAATRRAVAGFVRPIRTTRMPTLFCAVGEIRFAPSARAVVDAALGMTDLRGVRAVVADAVQRNICSPVLLAEELRGVPVRGSALLRRALAEVADGVRSTAEADLRELIVRARLPMPMFNPSLFVGQTFVAKPDCWWQESGVAVEVDSRAWHLSPQDWEQTMARHARMSAHGIIVLHFTPTQIRINGEQVAQTIKGALAAGKGRPLAAIRAVPAA